MALSSDTKKILIDALASMPAGVEVANAIDAATSGLSAIAPGGITVHTLTNNETFVIQNVWKNVAMNGTAATQTTLMPSAPIVGQTVKLTVLSGSGIAAWTLNGSGANFFPAAPTAIAAGDWIEYAYVVLGPNKYWVRMSGSI